jgi:hypothetical protein
MRKLFLGLFLLASGCSYEWFLRYPLDEQQLDQLPAQIEQSTGCRADTIDTKYRTLLTQQTDGCGRSQVWAYDWMLDTWFLDISSPPARPPAK